LAVEEVAPVRQPRAAALLHPADELAMDRLLQPVQALDILLALGAERVPEGLLLARGVDAPLDAELPDGVVEAEAGGDDADRANDRAGIGVDLVRRAGQPVPARGRH